MNEKNQNSFEFLKLITDEFIKNNIHHWLECGTLLGAYRESNFIEHDTDIDIGVLIEQVDVVKTTIKNIEKTNRINILKFEYEGNNVDDKFIKLIYKKNDVIVDCRWMDICFFEKKDSIFQASLFSTNEISKLKTLPSQILNLTKIKLNGHYFNAPSNVENFLKVRYGNNYMIPQKRCDELNKEWWQMDDNVGNEYLLL